MKTAALITHTHPPTALETAALAVAMAPQDHWRLVATKDELAKHQEVISSGISEVEDLRDANPDLCIVLGGDGSVLYGLRHFANTGVPVFGINYGTVGFLTTVERENAKEGLYRAFAGDYETIGIPALEATLPPDADIHVSGDPGPYPTFLAINDFAFSRIPHSRMAELHYQICEEEVGHVRCDGLVVSTPVGSTGYNLANNGPILAWGTKGFIVSYISPHSLTARPLVVGPDDVLCIGNAAGRDAVEIEVDGQHVGSLAAGQEIELRFVEDVSLLAQVPGTSFYKRIRSKFGHLAA